MIKVVLWDIDGTVLNFLASEKACVKKGFEAFHLGECTDEMVQKYSAINLKYWEALERREIRKSEILVARFHDFFIQLGIDSQLAIPFNDLYEYNLGDSVFFFDHALETITALKGRVMQCAVTNGTKKVQDRKLVKSGLIRLMDHIFISEVVGYEKPSSRYFDAVFSAIGNPSPKEVMIVGDSLTSDMAGGDTYGLVTCFFDPYHKNPPTSLRIDYHIDDLAEVAEIVLSSQ